MTGDRVLVALGEPAGRNRWLVEHAGRSYVVFVEGADLVVTDAECPHKQGPLVEGLIRDGAIVCPWHWYAYDLKTGLCRVTDQYELRRYPVVERDGILFAEVTSAPKPSWSELLRAHARPAATEQS